MERKVARWRRITIAEADVREIRACQQAGRSAGLGHGFLEHADERFHLSSGRAKLRIRDGGWRKRAQNRQDGKRPVRPSRKLEEWKLKRYAVFGSMSHILFKEQVP